MTREQFQKKQYHLSVTAGMNQRYHQGRADFWRRCDGAVRITVGVLATAGACLAVVAPTMHSGNVDIASMIVAGLAAFAAISLNVLPLGDWASRHDALFQRWTDFREDIDAVSLDFESENAEPPERLLIRLKELDAKVHRICGAEPTPRKKILERCYTEEQRSRHPGKTLAAT